MAADGQADARRSCYPHLSPPILVLAPAPCLSLAWTRRPAINEPDVALREGRAANGSSDDHGRGRRPLPSRPGGPQLAAPVRLAERGDATSEHRLVADGLVADGRRRGGVLAPRLALAGPRRRCRARRGCFRGPALAPASDRAARAAALIYYNNDRFPATPPKRVK